MAETFELDFGTVAVKKIRKRGWLSNALDKLGDLARGAANTVANVFERIGDANFDRTFTFGVAAGTPGKRTNIFADHPTSVFPVTFPHSYSLCLSPSCIAADTDKRREEETRYADSRLFLLAARLLSSSTASTATSRAASS